jgi:thioredoxin 1
MAAERIEQGDRTVAELIELYKDRLLVLIFYAEWCSPCWRLLKEILPAVAQRAGKGVAICPIDVKEKRNISPSWKHKAKNIPTLIFFREGKEIDRINGMAEPKEFSRKIKLCQKRKT